MSAVELALVRFPKVTTATNVFAAARDRLGPDAPWIRQAGLVEHHPNGHWVLRGTFAGHYLDLDEALHVSQSGAGEGAVGGAALGVLGGPPGIAVGLVVGALIGAVTGKPSERDVEPEALADDLHKELPAAGSAIALIAPTQLVDEMIAGLGDQSADVVREPLTPEQISALETSLSEAPPASPGPSKEGEEAAERPI